MNKQTFVALLAVATGCYDGIDDSSDLASELGYDDTTVEIVENLRLAGFPDQEIGVLEDGTVFVGQDAEVSLEASREMLVVEDDNERDRFRQYRTNNLVGSFVDIICIDGSAFGGTLSSGLNNAIANYNNQNLSFKMVRTTGSNNGCDAEITMVPTNGGGGSAGFPSNGFPWNVVNIGVSVANSGVAVATHVITHELGHCIGFRHSDFYDRSISCGGAPSNEGSGGVGATQIPGTPASAVFNGSVMNSCFNGGSTGVWTNTDTIALNALYGGGGGGGQTCEGRCGSFDNNASCQCDDQCNQFGDCCPDKVAECDAPQPSPLSCVGQCGNNAGQCWCDAQCAQFGDCCADKVAICG